MATRHSIHAIGIFGLVSTTSIIVKAGDLSDLDVIAHITRYLPASNEKPNFTPFISLLEMMD